MEDLEKYRKYRNQFNRLKRMAQKAYYACKVEELGVRLKIFGR